MLSYPFTSQQWQHKLRSMGGLRPAHLVIVVIQVRVSALQLHHLNAGHPVLLPLRHQVTVGVPDSPVPNPAPSVTEGWGDKKETKKK